MKKFLAIAIVTVMMMLMCSVSAFAELSPSAKPNDGDTSGSSTSPQTGDSAVLYGAAALFMAAAASCFAVKKIKE